MRPTRSDMIRSEQQEASRIRRFLQGDLDTSVVWLAPGIPSHANAVLMATELDIRRVSVKATTSDEHNGMRIYFAVVICRRGNRSQAGASCSHSLPRCIGDRETAIELAFRNSVRQLIPQGGVKLAWRDKRKEARRYT
jgi:hypothetical protein